MFCLPPWSRATFLGATSLCPNLSHPQTTICAVFPKIVPPTPALHIHDILPRGSALGLFPWNTKKSYDATGGVRTRPRSPHIADHITTALLARDEWACHHIPTSYSGTTFRPGRGRDELRTLSFPLASVHLTLGSHWSHQRGRGQD